MSEKIKYILTDWFERAIPEYIERDITVDIFEENMILAIAGVRRAGKTYSLYQIITKLRNEIPKENIIFINFEDDRLYPLESNELRQLLPTYIQNFLHNSSYPIYLFLDEIQNINEWERTIRNIYDTKKNVKIAITGSNSKLLSSEIATSLRGRCISRIIYPLSFREFLKFRNYQIDALNLITYSNKKDEIICHFNDFLEMGGFPQVVLAKRKTEILMEYYRSIFYRDIVERYEIRNIRLFENFMKLAIQSVGSLFSFGKAKNTLESIGFKVSKNTLIEYMKMMQSAFLIYEVPIFSYTVKDQLQYPRKIYICDTGLRNAVCFRFSEDTGKLLENIVFTSLVGKGVEVYYWKDKNGYEVDFLIREKNRVTNLIQVCYEVVDYKTRKREERPLFRAMEMFKLNRALILTFNTQDEVKFQAKTIVYKPIWLWLLENDKSK